MRFLRKAERRRGMGHEIKLNQIHLYITPEDWAFSLLFQEVKMHIASFMCSQLCIYFWKFHVISKFSSYFLFTVLSELHSNSDNILIFTPRNLYRNWTLRRRITCHYPLLCLPMAAQDDHFLPFCSFPGHQLHILKFPSLGGRKHHPF